MRKTIVMEAVRELLNEAYVATNVLSFSTGYKDPPLRWVWKTKESRENRRVVLYDILFQEKILVVAGDMLDQKDAIALGFKKRFKHSVGKNPNWQIRLDEPNLERIVKNVIQKVTPKHIQEVISKFH